MAGLAQGNCWSTSRRSSRVIEYSVIMSRGGEQEQREQSPVHSRLHGEQMFIHVRLGRESSITMANGVLSGSARRHSTGSILNNL